PARQESEAGGRPFVVEAAFGLLPYDAPGRVLRVGLKWAPSLTVPVNDVHPTIEKAANDEGFSAFVGPHIVTPRLGFTDRGKAQCSLPLEVVAAVWSALARVVREVTKARKRQRRAEDQLTDQAYERLVRRERSRIKVKDAA